MTVLDFDPPQPTLRLVSTNGTAPNRDHRYRTSAPLYGDSRELYRQVLQAALQWQAPIDADALRVVLAAKQTTTAGPARAFSATGIWQLMFVDVVTWCRNRQLEVPAGCASALTTMVNYLETTAGFDPDSDPVDDLHDAIDECTGGWCDPVHPSAAPPKGRGSLRSKRGPKRT